MIRHLLADPTFWVLLATVMCVGFIGWKAWRPILMALDARAVGIRQRLDEAETLRVEAQAILEEYKQKSRDALHEADEIMQNARTRAEQLQKQMETELTETIARYEANAKSRMARIEAEAVDAVKSKIIAAALDQAQTRLKSSGAAANDIVPSLDALTGTLRR